MYGFSMTVVVLAFLAIPILFLVGLVKKIAKKPTRAFRKAGIAAIIMVVGGIGAGVFEPTAAEIAARDARIAATEAKKEIEAAQLAATTRTSDIAKLTDDLDASITLLHAKPDLSGADKTTLYAILAIANNSAKAYVASAEYPELTKQRAEIKPLLVSYQKTMFPRVRKAYAEMMDGLMWKANVDVYAEGSNRTTLHFVGGILASNASVSEVEQQMSEGMHMMRFKRLKTSWYRGSEYHYYTYDTPSDATIAVIDGHIWKPV